MLTSAPSAARPPAASAAVPPMETFSALINLAGRQRMLSQRLVLFCVLAAQGQDAARTTAGEALALFRDSHAQLLQSSRDLPAPFGPALEAAFFGPAGVQAPVADFIERAERVLAALRGGASAGIDGLVERATPVLAVLNQLTQAFETQARQASQQQRKAHGELMNRIELIAREARIVSLNARVIAARAGTDGREFAVVAQELSNISEQIESLARVATATS